ncbi:unnamed protein product [Lepeophtheirus salmonis]|uniref:(salmon louse) hypothetical protein n=1 Tax=Lepeophtheirus salmonis TaxID=72036 RepID=A0A7R8H2V1_LEPSM|nr:unnamed protein product [Lepeophtheirus salmonis]CAF2832786.1 unnamed protein product [Lepeophtheirus salmonis]
MANKNDSDASLDLITVQLRSLFVSSNYGNGEEYSDTEEIVYGPSEHLRVDDISFYVSDIYSVYYEDAQSLAHIDEINARDSSLFCPDPNLIIFFDELDDSDNEEDDEIPVPNRNEEEDEEEDNEHIYIRLVERYWRPKLFYYGLARSH